MDRTAQLRFLKTANSTALDVLARAKFLEGMAGRHEGTVVRNQPAAALSRDIIPELLSSVLSHAQEQTGVVPNAAALYDLDVWRALGNSRLYDRVYQIVARLYDDETALSAMARAMFSETGAPSTLWAAGRLTGKNPTMLANFARGQYMPVDAVKILATMARRDALDLVRVQRRREEIMDDEGGTEAVTQNVLDGMSADEWEMVIDRLTADPQAPGADAFWDWFLDQAQKAATPAVVALFESIADGREKSQEQIAAEFGLTPGAVSKAKGEFVRYLTGLLATDRALDRQPEVLNFLSDANFLHDLYTGRVRGDRVAGEVPEALKEHQFKKEDEDKEETQKEAALRTSLIRLAHTQPALRDVLLPLLRA